MKTITCHPTARNHKELWKKLKVCKWFHSNFKREKFPVLKYISRTRSRFWLSLKFTAHHFQLSKLTIFFPPVITRDKTFQPVKTNQHQPPTEILKQSTSPPLSQPGCFQLSLMERSSSHVKYISVHIRAYIDILY